MSDTKVYALPLPHFREYGRAVMVIGEPADYENMAAAARAALARDFEQTQREHPEYGLTEWEFCVRSRDGEPPNTCPTCHGEQDACTQCGGYGVVAVAEPSTARRFFFGWYAKVEDE